MSFDDSFTDKISAKSENTHDELQNLRGELSQKKRMLHDDAELRGYFTQRITGGAQSENIQKPALPPIKLYSLEKLQREIKQEWSENTPDQNHAGNTVQEPSRAIAAVKPKTLADFPQAETLINQLSEEEAKELQRFLQVEDDGIIGPITRGKIEKFLNNPARKTQLEQKIQAIQAERPELRTRDPRNSTEKLEKGPLIEQWLEGQIPETTAENPEGWYIRIFRVNSGKLAIALYDKWKLRVTAYTSPGAEWKKTPRYQNKKLTGAVDEDHRSSIYPKPFGWAPMPYAVHIEWAYWIHGSHKVNGWPLSHGCIRVKTKPYMQEIFRYVKENPGNIKLTVEDIYTKKRG